MPKARLTTETVIHRGAQLLDEVTSDGLSLGLRRGTMIRAKSSVARTLGQAAIGRSRDDAIRSLSFAYRRWALDHPVQYPMTIRPPVAGDDDDKEASFSILDVIFNVLAGYDLRDDDAVDATRFPRSALHGFVALETSGALELPVDPKRSCERVVESVVAALATWRRS